MLLASWWVSTEPKWVEEQGAVHIFGHLATLHVNLHSCPSLRNLHPPLESLFLLFICQSSLLYTEVDIKRKHQCFSTALVQAEAFWESWSVSESWKVPLDICVVKVSPVMRAVCFRLKFESQWYKGSQDLGLCQPARSTVHLAFNRQFLSEVLLISTGKVLSPFKI